LTRRAVNNPNSSMKSNVWLCERRALSQNRVVFGMGELVPKTEVFGTDMGGIMQKIFLVIYADHG
jgi:hypothetical protein